MDQGQPPSQCPKCGSPRLPEAVDCAFCGIVFERYDHGQQPAPPAPPPTQEVAPPAQPVAAPPAPPAAPVRTPTTAPRTPSTPPRRLTAHERFLKSIEGNLGAVVAIALLVHLAAAALFSTYIIGGSDETMRVRATHRTALDRPVPEGFKDGAVLWFVGRHVVLLSNQAEGMVYLLYYEGALARTTPPEELRQDALTLLDQLQIPWRQTGQSQGQLHGREITVDRLEIEFQPNFPSQAYVSVFSTPQGRTVGLFFMGPEKPATKLAKELFIRGF